MDTIDIKRCGLFLTLSIARKRGGSRVSAWELDGDVRESGMGVGVRNETDTSRGEKGSKGSSSQGKW